MKMGEIDIQDYARQRLEAHGDKAVAEAARKASTSEKEGKTKDAETWRRIAGSTHAQTDQQMDRLGYYADRSVPGRDRFFHC